jgi:acyl-CoA thioester hydrolase
VRKNIFELEMKVRDYECDLQGIVNNANYQHYLEHTRHEYLSSRGIDFAQLHREGKDAMVTRIELDYKIPLISGDKFVVTLSTEMEGRLRLIFYQDIYRKKDNQLCLRAKVTTVVMENNRPIPPDSIFNS